MAGCSSDEAPRLMFRDPSPKGGGNKNHNDNDNDDDNDNPLMGKV